MKKIFTVKYFTGDPIDSVENILKSIFERIPSSEIELHVEGIFDVKGAMTRMRHSRWFEFVFRRWDAILGTGTVKDIPFVMFRGRAKYIINFQTILLKGGDGPWNPKTPWFLRKYLFSRADMVISPSRFTAGTVKRYFPEKHVVDILNGIDLGMFNPEKKDLRMLSEKYQIRTDKPIMAFVGTLQERKRPDVFIELARRIPDAHFVCVGKKYPQWDFLSGTESIPNFQWVPKMPRPDVAALLASSCAFIFPSLNEPAAAVVLESMASGTVPVLSLSGGNPEFLGESGAAAGYLVPNDSHEHEIEKFTEILRALIADPHMRNEKAAAARREAERHSYDAVSRQYQEAILDIWNKD